MSLRVSVVDSFGDYDTYPASLAPRGGSALHEDSTEEELIAWLNAVSPRWVSAELKDDRFLYSHARRRKRRNAMVIGYDGRGDHVREERFPWVRNMQDETSRIAYVGGFVVTLTPESPTVVVLRLDQKEIARIPASSAREAEPHVPEILALDLLRAPYLLTDD